MNIPEAEMEASENQPTSMSDWPLEVQSQCELNLTTGAQTDVANHSLPEQPERSASCTGRIRLTWLVHIRRAECAVAKRWKRQIQSRTWDVEVSAIEYVEDFRSEFNIGGFREFETLIENQIELLEIRASQEISRHITKRSRLRCCKCRWI